MTCRVDSSLIAGACVVGDRGLGVLGSVIRATTGPGSGPHGAGYLYNDWQAGDDGREFRGLIVTPPSAGTFTAFEDGSVSLVGAPDGSYSFTYRLYVDGVDLGTAPPASITIGAPAALTASVAGVAAFTVTATGSVSVNLISVAPINEPVTIDEAKRSARISDTTAFDDQLPTLIAAARRLAEQETGREFTRKTTRYSFSDWPSADCQLHAFQASAVAISYWSDGGWTTLAPESFAFFELGNATAIAPAVGTVWPPLAPVAGGPRVRVDVTAGPLDPSTVDACVKQYIQALVAYWIDNPCATAPGSMQPAPFLSNLLDPLRLWG